MVTELDFRTVAADALACMVASYGDEPAVDVAQSIRMRCAMAVNAHSMGLLCGHDQCFPVVLGAVFHATVILAEQAGFDLLTDLQDAVNAIRVLQETRKVVDSCSTSPADTDPPVGVCGEPDTRTVPPDGVGVGDLPDSTSGERTSTVPPDGTGDDLTPPHGIVRPAFGSRARREAVFVPVVGDPEFNVIPFPTPAVMPSPCGELARAITNFASRVWARYRKT